MSAAARTWIPVVLAGLLVVLLAGCGANQSTVELSPLSARLAQIDDSLAAQRFEQARRDLTALAADTRGARDAGEISATRADAVLDAIVALRAALPAPAPTATPTPTPTPTTTATPADTSTSPADKESTSKGKGAGKGKGSGPR